MAAAAAKLGHVLRFLTVFRTVFSEFAVGWDRAGTTRMSALLRLIHNAPCSQDLFERLSHSPGRPKRPTVLPESRAGARRANQACSVAGGVRRASISRWVRRMLHQSLCSAMGIPHSTQIRTRCRGSVLRENSFFRNDMGSPLRFYPETDLGPRRFAESSKKRDSARTAAAEEYNSPRLAAPHASWRISAVLCRRGSRNAGSVT